MGVAGTQRDARVFVDGMLSDPQLDHPEGLAVHPDGSVWCGGEAGQVFRVEADGSGFEQVASTGGYCLGLAFSAGAEWLYVCDLKRAALLRVEVASGRVALVADHAGPHRMRVPNFPAVDAAGRIYVSDSHGQGSPGPGVVRLEPDGAGELWYAEPMQFANGLALAADGRALYVAETFAHAVRRIPIEDDGSAGRPETVVELPGVLPDGLAVAADGAVYVGCYEPSQVLRIDPDGTVHTVLHDPTAHLLCHPTNVAFRGSELLTANLGRCHLTVIDAGVTGVPLPVGAAG